MTVDVEWPDPPRDPPQSQGPRNPAQQVHDSRMALLREISRQPGRWALFATLGRPGSATDLAVRVRQGRYLPGFDATMSDTNVYVRYVGKVPLDRKPAADAELQPVMWQEPGDAGLRTVTWQEPPDLTRIGKAENMQIFDRRMALLGAITERPGIWAFFETAGTPDSAKKMATRLRQGTYLPGFESKNHGTEVYVRYRGSNPS